jgi:hypothetical protein
MAVLKKLLSLGAVLASAVLASCGGGGDGTINGGGGGAAEVGSITVLAASPQLQSDQSQATTVTITAQVKDNNNAVLEGVTVQFSATSGSLAVTQAVSDSLGMAVAQLSNGTNLSNRAITVTAQAGSAAGNVVVNVVGTSISITGPAALALGDTGAYVAVVRDSKSAGIAGQTVALTSANGNTIAAPSLTTDVSGNVAFNVTATTAGNDTLTVSGLGLTATKAVSVSGDAFAFTAPAASAEINLGVPQAVTVNWTKSGVPQVGETITFSTTRGTLSAGSAITNGSGDATVTITGINSGAAVVTATNDEATSTNRSIEFVATTAATLDLQASRLTMGVGEQSELSAVVRDAANNLVKNKVVEFQISSGSSGSLSVGTATTDSQGLAKSVYTAGGTTGAGGVEITATVQGAPLVTDMVALTVAGQAYFITLGTGNELFEPDTARYAKEWSITVTDVQGRPVAGQSLQTSIRSKRYMKGGLAWEDPPGAWNYAAGSPLYCADEDSNKDGILDLAIEDTNGNGLMEAGNIASVAAVPASASASAPCTALNAQGSSAAVTTNTQGNARVCVFYPQNYAEWVEVTLTATAPVGGSEFSRSSVFTLQVLASDVDSETDAPPNGISPFGADLDCGTPPP